MEALASNTVFDRVRIVRQAVTPTEVSFPNLRVMLAMGVILVTGLVGGLIVLRELLDQRVRGPSDLSMINRLSVLGVIPDAATDPARPKAVETSFRDAPMGVMSEAFRQVRAPLIKRMDQAGHRSLLVIGGMPESGATTVAANLAQAAASSDERVLLIDANMRRPAVHKVFKTADKPGLSDVLAGQVKLADAVQSAGENLWVLTAGTPALRGLTERLASETMSRLLAEAGAQYERIFVDAPPAIVSGDGLNLANRCDATVLVVRALQEKRGLVARLRGMFGEARSEFLGVIVNAVRPSAGGYMRGNIQATHEYQKATAA
jgi:capsular exopolysaccharide synthesis family protein